MNTVLISTAYIQSLLESNTNIECIEVWATILYARMKKGCGRNKFISKKGLEFKLPIYYYESNYIPLTQRYHPDTQSGIKERKICKQRTLTKLQQSINLSRGALAGLFKGRGSSGIRFTINHELFTKFTRAKSRTLTNKFVELLGKQLSKAGYSDHQSFGRYCDRPLEKQSWEDLQTINPEEKTIFSTLKTIFNKIEKLKEEYPEQYINEETDPIFLEFGW